MFYNTFMVEHESKLFMVEHEDKLFMVEHEDKLFIVEHEAKLWYLYRGKVLPHTFYSSHSYLYDGLAKYKNCLLVLKNSFIVSCNYPHLFLFPLPIHSTDYFNCSNPQLSWRGDGIWRISRNQCIILSYQDDWMPSALWFLLTYKCTPQTTRLLQLINLQHKLD